MSNFQFRTTPDEPVKPFQGHPENLAQSEYRLSEYLNAADAALKRKKLEPALAPFSKLREIYETHQNTWNGLVPCFDASTQTIDPDTASCFIAYSANGEPVSAVAVRVWDITGSNLRDEVESLRLFYGNGVNNWRNRVEIELSSPIAEHLTGWMMYCGAFWVRPDFRGIGLGKLLPPLAAYHAMKKWPVDYKISIGAPAFVEPELQEMYQFESYEPGFRMSIDGQVYYKGGLLWSRASHVLDKLDTCRRWIPGK